MPLLPGLVLCILRRAIRNSMPSLLQARFPVVVVVVYAPADNCATPASSLDPASLRTKVPGHHCLPKARIAMHGHDRFMDALFCCSAARRSAARVVIRYRKGYTRGGLCRWSPTFLVNKQRTSFALRVLQHLMFVRVHVVLVCIILRLGG